MKLGSGSRQLRNQSTKNSSHTVLHILEVIYTYTRLQTQIKYDYLHTHETYVKYSSNTNI